MDSSGISGNIERLETPKHKENVDTGIENLREFIESNGSINETP